VEYALKDITLALLLVIKEVSLTQLLPEFFVLNKLPLT
jgi:hypothetical protein